MKTFNEFMSNEKDQLLYKLADMEYLANGESWREQMSEDQDDGTTEPWVYEKEEVIDFIASYYEDLSIEELRAKVK